MLISETKNSHLNCPLGKVHNELQTSLLADLILEPPSFVRRSSVILAFQNKLHSYPFLADNIVGMQYASTVRSMKISP